MKTEKFHSSEWLEDITQHCTEVEGRIFHYRKVGEGPAVVMLHDSPRSSRLHLETMRALSHTYTVYAFDTPGYGNSEPLEKAKPTIRDFANALAAAIDRLELGGAPIYATHTSAKIALEYGAQFGRTHKLILDGLSIPTAAPNPDFIGRYMRPMAIDDGGGYLAAEWTRMRDMVRWFPWFERQPDKRMPIDRPSDEWVADYVIDFFAAGPHYSSAYEAAMYYDPMPALRSVACPTLVAARSDDVLYASLDRVPLNDNPALTVERLQADRAAWLKWLEKAFQVETPVTAPESDIRHRAKTACFVDLSHGQMLVHRGGPAAAIPLLILDAPTTLRARRWQQSLSAQATLVPELPGFGESAALASPSLTSAADALAEMLDALGIETVDLLAVEFATPLAASLAHRHPGRVRTILLDGCFTLDQSPTDFAERLCPQFAFDRAGAHLHQYWHMLRDMDAQWPWHDGNAGTRRYVPPVLSADELHRALVGILKQPASYGDIARAACLAAEPDRYPGFTQPAWLLHRAEDPAYKGTLALADRLSNAKIVDLPADWDATAQIVAGLLEQIALAMDVAA